MVFTPRQSLLPDSIGRGSALPRSVPADAGVTQATGLLGAGAALASAGFRRMWTVLLITLVLSGPWLLPALAHAGSALSTPDAAAVFGARQEGWGTPVLSLLGLGGFWNADVMP